MENTNPFQLNKVDDKYQLIFGEHILHTYTADELVEDFDVNKDGSYTGGLPSHADTLIDRFLEAYNKANVPEGSDMVFNLRDDRRSELKQTLIDRIDEEFDVVPRIEIDSVVRDVFSERDGGFYGVAVVAGIPLDFYSDRGRLAVGDASAKHVEQYAWINRHMPDVESKVAQAVREEIERRKPKPRMYDPFQQK